MSKYQTKKGQQFEAELWRYMKLRRINSFEELRQLTTIGSNVTMGKYRDDPTLIPVGKLLEIMRAVRMPKDERVRIINMLGEE